MNASSVLNLQLRTSNSAILNCTQSLQRSHFQCLCKVIVIVLLLIIAFIYLLAPKGVVFVLFCLLY